MEAEIKSDTPGLMPLVAATHRHSVCMSQGDRFRHNPRLGTMVLVQTRMALEHQEMLTQAADAHGIGRSEYLERLINSMRDQFDGELPALPRPPRPRREMSPPRTFYLSPASREELRSLAYLTGAGLSGYLELLLDEAAKGGQLPAVEVESEKGRTKISAA